MPCVLSSPLLGQIFKVKSKSKPISLKKNCLLIISEVICNLTEKKSKRFDYLSVLWLFIIADASKYFITNSLLLVIVLFFTQLICWGRNILVSRMLCSVLARIEYYLVDFTYQKWNNKLLNRNEAVIPNIKLF